MSNIINLMIMEVVVMIVPLLNIINEMIMKVVVMIIQLLTMIIIIIDNDSLITMLMAMSITTVNDNHINRQW